MEDTADRLLIHRGIIGMLREHAARPCLLMTLRDSFVFDSGRRFGSDVVQDPAHARNQVDDPS